MVRRDVEKIIMERDEALALVASMEDACRQLEMENFELRDDIRQLQAKLAAAAQDALEWQGNSEVLGVLLAKEKEHCNGYAAVLAHAADIIGRSLPDGDLDDLRRIAKAHGVAL